MAAKRTKTKPGPPPGFIFRPYITLRSGEVIFAKDYGLKAFRIALRALDHNPFKKRA